MNTENICAICHEHFKNKCSLTKHVMKAHGITNKIYFDTYIEPNTNHICPICKVNERKWHRNAYLITCSNDECKSSSISFKNSVTQQNQETRQKYKNTCMAKYGVDNASKADVVKSKIVSTLTEKYGVDYHSKFYEMGGCAVRTWNAEANEKRKQTNLLKYGTENYRSSDAWKDRIKQIAYDRTVTEKAEIKNKRIQTCLSKYGKPFVTQTPLVKDKIFKKRIFNTCKANKPSIDGIVFDSKLEMAVYEYCKCNNIEVKYHPCSLSYIDSFGEEHSYFPDFEINGELFEVKGSHLIKDGHLYCPFRAGLTQIELDILDDIYLAKTNCMKENNVKMILSIDDIKSYLHELINH